jgi:hypothetical protein
LQLSAVINARTLGYIETFDLAPRGEVFFPEIVQELVKRYSFQKFPKTLEEFDQSKGIEFLEGKTGNNSIQKFVIFNTLLIVETRSSTTDSKEIMEGMLEWGAAKFGLTYRPGMIRRYAYVSDLSFYSEAPLLNVSPVLANLAAKASRLLTDIWQEPVQYESVNLTVGHDPMARKYGIAPFSITRRAEARFSENKYFSEAPLPTDDHIALLEEFERDVERLHGAARKQK